MIEFEKKEDCCGCYACMTVCPVSCIKMQEDDEGFSYPVINKDQCINCSLCQKVCPVINIQHSRKPIKVYACKNKSLEVRLKSSSGGLFSSLAKQIILEGGVVFGACFNEKNEVVHDYISTIAGLDIFRRSKYVQSNVGYSYRIVENYLKSGKPVLFSGTPCQVLGLRLYLKKTYSNLSTVDFICHGVPSPKVWNIYIKELSKKYSSYKIANINFRDKEHGWNTFSFSLDFIKEDHVIHFSEPMYLNHYMRGYLSDLYLRPSCHQCSTRCLKSGSDITLGDFWGNQNSLDDFVDNKGISAVLLNTSKGEMLFKKLDCDSMKSSYEDVLSGNPSIERSHPKPTERDEFYSLLNHRQFASIIQDLTKMNFKERMKLKLMNLHIIIDKLKK